MSETLEEPSSSVGEIDTSAPFESVREAASRFGGFGFWKPSSHNLLDPSQDKVDEADMMEKASELEKELILKEEETLKVLKSLEATKAIVEDLKSKLNQKQEKEENFDYMNVSEELNKAKIDLCKTSQDLASIRESIEILNKRLQVDIASLEKTREGLNSENASRISKEIQRLSKEAKEFGITGEKARSAVCKAVAEIEQTRSKIKTAELRLVAARKMKEAARAAEAVAIAEIKSAKRRRRQRNNEETLQETAKTEVEEEEETLQGKWKWSEHRRRSRSSLHNKYKNTSPQEQNQREMLLMMGVNSVNSEGTSSSSGDVSKPTMSIGQILSRKLLLADQESAMVMMNERVSLGQILGKSNYGSCERKEKERKLNGKRKRFGFAKLSVMLNKENKRKKVVLNLR
ncbi:unnamed protein product [Cochlearia groenlandica]